MRVVGAKASLGQTAPSPVQVSATSHGPAASRHGMVLGANASEGQVALTPLQVSATSQVSAAPRHT
jgi:hypothetical protein